MFHLANIDRSSPTLPPAHYWPRGLLGTKCLPSGRPSQAFTKKAWRSPGSSPPRRRRSRSRFPPKGVQHHFLQLGSGEARGAKGAMTKQTMMMRKTGCFPWPSRESKADLGEIEISKRCAAIRIFSEFMRRTGKTKGLPSDWGVLGHPATGCAVQKPNANLSSVCASLNNRQFPDRPLGTLCSFLHPRRRPRKAPPNQAVRADLTPSPEIQGA